jgi:hypothetical protein
MEMLYRLKGNLNKDGAAFKLSDLKEQYLAPLNKMTDEKNLPSFFELS